MSDKEKLNERWLKLAGLPLLKEESNIDESIDTSDWQEELDAEFGLEPDLEEASKDEN